MLTFVYQKYYQTWSILRRNWRTCLMYGMTCDAVTVLGKAASWELLMLRRSEDDSDKRGIPRLSRMGHIKPRALRTPWPGHPVRFLDKEQIPPTLRNPSLLCAYFFYPISMHPSNQSQIDQVPSEWPERMPSDDSVGKQQCFFSWITALVWSQ